MDYTYTQPDAIVRFHASDMCLHIDSNAAYLVNPKARSRAVGHYYLSNNPPLPHIRPTPALNGPILTKCQTIRTIMASAAEAKTGLIFLNGQQAIPIRTDLLEMGHPQPPTPIKTDSATYRGILASNMRRKRSKYFDMSFHWMRCRIKQNQLRLYWQKGNQNLADYFTKSFPPEHHQQMRYIYLQRANSKISSQRKTQLRGCVPSTDSQEFIHSCLTAQARPSWCHVQNYMLPAYCTPFISAYIARAYRA